MVFVCFVFSDAERQEWRSKWSVEDVARLMRRVAG
jgi:hypothetical protein